MWTCESCGEQAEENFDACWNCGTGRDGSPPPPEFQQDRETKSDKPVAPPPSLDLEKELQSRFWCRRCQHTEALVKRIATGSAEGLSAMLEIHGNVFIFLSCKKCGYTEFFNPEVLNEMGTLERILDMFFGD